MPSEEPEASIVPSGENATDRTHPVCPSREAIFSLVSGFHSRTPPDADPETSVFPSGENTTDKTSVR